MGVTSTASRLTATFGTARNPGTRSYGPEAVLLLAEAGLELGENGLSFQMSDGQNPAEDDRRSQGEALPIFTQTTEMTQRAEDELASRPRSAYGFLLSGRSGVDLQV